MRESIAVAAPADLAGRVSTAVRALTQRPTHGPPPSEFAARAAANHSPATRDDPAELLAMLAAGRFDLVKPMIAAAGSLWNRAGDDSLRRALVAALVTARYAAWTGDLAPAAGAWEHMRAPALRSPTPGDAGLAVLRAGVWTALERVASDVGDPQLAGLLHPLARTARGALLEHQPSPHDALLALALALPVPRAGDAHQAALAEPAAVILELVHGLLGAQPDASRHRLRLQPRPVGTAPLEIRDLGFGDGTVSFTASRDGADRVFRASQDSGAIPATLLLEPWLAPGEVLMGATVDGRPASLTPRPEPGGTVVPVQLVLDEVRELRLVLDAQRPPTE